MGRVYLARDTRLNRLVALKILAPERMNNSRAVDRFKREARVGAQLQHENLVRIYDFGQANGRFFLVMEYIEGKTIGALITAQGSMPVPTAARFTWQIALGLEHAHRKGLIHRDVNPNNVLVTHEGIAKLADLGLAIDLAEAERVTREGATVGTFDYVAPEQARYSHAADIRSDIYSLGCTLYHMVAGQVPFPSPSLAEKLFAHQALEPTPLNQLIPHIATDFVEVVQRMMRQLPDERCATPLQVAQALEPFIEEYPRIRDGEPVPVPLIVDEPAEQPVVSPPVLAEVQADALPPALVLQPQLAAGSGRQPSSPSPSPELGRGRPAAAPSFLTPVSDNESNSSTEDIPLILDLGPEPSLTDSLSRSRSWFGSDKPVRTQGATASASQEQMPVADHLRGLLSWQSHPWLWWLDAAAVALALLVVGYALARWLGKDQKTAQHRNQEPAGKQVGTPQPGPSFRRVDGTGGAGRETVDPKREPEPAITVLTGDGEEKPVADLFQAMETAVGAKGWVVLHNCEPLSLPAREQPINLFGTGWLKLRAAQGVKPVLIVELKGQKPFLTVGPSMNLNLEGLTFEARYLDPLPGGPASPTPGAHHPGRRPSPDSILCLRGGKRNQVERHLRARRGWKQPGDRELLVQGFSDSSRGSRHRRLDHAGQADHDRAGNTTRSRVGRLGIQDAVHGRQLQGLSPAAHPRTLYGRRLGSAPACRLLPAISASGRGHGMRGSNRRANRLGNDHARNSLESADTAMEGQGKPA